MRTSLSPSLPQIFTTVVAIISKIAVVGSLSMPSPSPSSLWRLEGVPRRLFSHHHFRRRFVRGGGAQSYCRGGGFIGSGHSSQLSVSSPAPRCTTAALPASSKPITTTAACSTAVTEQMGIAAENETDLLQEYFENLSSRSRSENSDLLPTLWTSKEEAARFIGEEIDTVLFDCDGVLYRTQDPCPGASDCIRSLIVDQRKNVFFVTNNSATNRRQLKEKLSKLLHLDDDDDENGVLQIEQMVSSAYCCARYLQQQFALQDDKQTVNDKGGDQTGKRVRRVHVIGSTGLCEELASAGFEITGGPDFGGIHDDDDDDVDDGNNNNNRRSSSSGKWGTMTRQDLEEYPFDEHPPIDALVVGHDVSMNFRKLTIADNLLLRNPDALFVASNEDSFDLVGSDARHIPGNGATVKALEYCSNRKAINVGKPSTTLTEILRQDYPDAFGTKSNMGRCLFVGDRLDTDIQFALNNRMKSLLVMTGVTTAGSLIQDLSKQLHVPISDGGDQTNTGLPLPTFITPYVGMMV